MIDKVSDFIARHQLLSRDGLHVVAISGGADSVALLRILKQLDYRIEAAHCNFHLRGEESDRDEEFVKALCGKVQTPIHLIHFDTNEYASLHKVSIEMAARELRYSYFHRLCQDIGASTICVAHHRNDAVETLLMNLLRGSGIHGLTGIRPKNGIVVRPLLGLSRQQIEEYLHSIGQDYMTDSTNLVDDVLRNKIRLQVLPLLEAISPNAAENIGKTAHYIHEAEKVFSRSVLEQKRQLVQIHDSPEGSQSVSVSSLMSLASPECFLHEWLSPYGFNSTQVRQICNHLEGEAGREFLSPTHTLVIDRKALLLESIQAPLKTLRVPEEGHYRYMDGICFHIDKTEDISISKYVDCVTLDAEKVRFPLTIRPVQAGDRFSPFGMEGHRLVSDFLTDCKLSVPAKRRQLVVTDSDDRIIWLVRLRPDHHFRVTDRTTSVLRLRYEKNNK